MDYNLKDFGHELYSLRKILNYNYEDVNYLSGISEKTIYRLENGLNRATHRTLESLSMVYKVDLMELLNEKFSNNPRIKLLSLKEKAERKLYNDDRIEIESVIESLYNIKTEQLISLEKVNLKQYIALMESFYYKNSGDLFKAITILENALKYNIESFRLSNYINYNYSQTELRVIMNLSLLNFELTYERHFIDILAYLLSLCNEDKIIYPKMLYNISFMYHIDFCNIKALEFADRGIEYCSKVGILSVIPKLYFRKGIAEFLLDQKNYFNSLSKSIFFAEFNKQQYLKSFIIKSLKRNYGIILNED